MNFVRFFSSKAKNIAKPRSKPKTFKGQKLDDSNDNDTLMIPSQELLPSNNCDQALPPLHTLSFPHLIQAKFPDIFIKCNRKRVYPFSLLKISESVREAFEERLHWKNLTLPQVHGVPIVLYGRHLVLSAFSGTGKTGVYLLPMLEKLARNPTDFISSMIVVPSTELAVQVKSLIDTLNLPFARPLLVTSLVNLDKQMSLIKKLNPNIVIGTPGRISTCLERNIFDFSKLTMLAMDECDYLLRAGWGEKNSISTFLDKAPYSCQKILVSATITKGFPAAKLLNTSDFELVDLNGKMSIPPNISLMAYSIPRDDKINLLLHLLLKSNFMKGRQTIVFLRSKVRARKTEEVLAKIGIKARCLATELNMARHRVQALKEFQSGSIQVLLCAENSVRGFDVPSTDAVVLLDIPYPPAEFVHCIGRCGRNGKPGLAISLVDDKQTHIVSYGGRKCFYDEAKIFFKVQKFIGRQIKFSECPIDTRHVNPDPKENRLLQERFPSYDQVAEKMSINEIVCKKSVFLEEK